MNPEHNPNPVFPKNGEKVLPYKAIVSGKGYLWEFELAQAGYNHLPPEQKWLRVTNERVPIVVCDALPEVGDLDPYPTELARTFEEQTHAFD